MRNRLVPLLCLALVSTSMFGVSHSIFGAKHKKDPGNLVPLDQVIQQVQAALDEYQNNLGTGKSALPPLSSAEFEFKTTTGTTVGEGVTLLVFKFGTSHEKDTVNEVTYKYSPKQSPTSAEWESNEPPPTLKDELAKTVQNAAKSVTSSTTAAGLPFNQLTVSLQYGVKWDVNASGSPQVSFVTVNLGGDKNKNTIQSVKLTWQVPKSIQQRAGAGRSR